MSSLPDLITAKDGHRDAELGRLPILILNVHSHCNCRCLMCDIWQRTKHEQINAADLERHRESLRKLGVQQVVLSGGEPLLHTDLEPLCSFFREQGIRLTLLTTGLLLHKRAREVAAHFDEVIVSIDGPASVHDAIRRVPGAFALICRGVAAVRALRPHMRISCRTTVQKTNHHQLCATARAARQAGFDAISFLAADLTSEAFNRPLIWPGERQSTIALTQAEIGVLETQVDALLGLNAEWDTRFVSEGREKLERIVRHFRVHLDLASPIAPICNAPWVSAVIETDGSLRPCFFHRAIGNVHSSTLDEAINGDRGRSFRQALDVERNPTCRRCVCSLNYSG
ncbi:MAG: radical SAM protein [Acidobacteriaceae bacterium]